MQDALSTPFAAAALVLGIAGLAKLRSPAGAVRALAVARLPGRGLVVRAFACGELALGAWCLLDPAPANAAALAAVYTAFSALSLLLARRRAACGCFGDGEIPASAVQALLSAALALVALLAVSAVPHGLGWVLGRPAWFVVVLAVGTAGSAYGAVIAYTELPQAWAAWSGR